MHHVFRYDDFSSASDEACEELFFGLLEASGQKCTVAAIPAVASPTWEPGDSVPLKRLTPARANTLSRWIRNGTVEIALHGYSHLALSRARHLMEFSRGVGRDQQRRMVQAGRSILEDLFGVPVATFVPPWNGYSHDTLAVLEELGFSVLSAGVSSTAAAGPLSYIPGTVTPADSLLALSTAARWDRDHSVVVTVVHDYDFDETDPAAGGLSGKAWENIIGGIASFPGIRGSNLSELASSGAHALGRERLIENARFRERVATFPRRLIFRGWGRVYWSVSRLESLARTRYLVP